MQCCCVLILVLPSTAIHLSIVSNLKCYRQHTCCLTSSAKLERSCRALHLQGNISLSIGYHARSHTLFYGCPAWSPLPLHVTKTSSDITDRDRLTHHMPHGHFIKGGMGSTKLGHLGCVYSIFYLSKSRWHLLRTALKAGLFGFFLLLFFWLFFFFVFFVF